MDKLDSRFDEISFDEHAENAANGFRTFGLWMLSAIGNDLLRNEVGKLFTTPEGIANAMTALFDYSILTINIIRQDAFIFDRFRYGKSNSFINQGNREKAINLGFNFLHTLKLRPTETLHCKKNQELNAGLCYEPCKKGFRGVAHVCWPDCPGGYKDIGISCTKPAPYGRGVGYPWKFGDKAFSLEAAKNRCNKDNPSLGCEKWGAIYYPKCKTGFHNVGCCVCSPDCKADASGKPMKDHGAFCRKNEYSRKIGKPISSCDGWIKLILKMHLMINWVFFVTLNVTKVKQEKTIKLGLKRNMNLKNSKKMDGNTEAVKNADVLSLGPLCAQIPGRVVETILDR